MANEFLRGRLDAKDPKKMEEFYGAVFTSWTFRREVVNGTEYLFIRTGNGPGGEMVKGSGSGWIPFVNVDDVGAALTAAQRNGGIIVENRTEFGGQGFYGVIKDPEGSVMGIWGRK